MYCKECGAVIAAENSYCPQCGTEISSEVKQTLLAGETSNMGDKAGGSGMEAPKDTKLSTWCWMAIISLLCGCFTLYKGINKMTCYDPGNPFSNLSVNAYVGGDAYNYIINGTYATAFFVLTSMFVLAAIGFIIIHYLTAKREE